MVGWLFGWRLILQGEVYSCFHSVVREARGLWKEDTRSPQMASPSLSFLHPSTMKSDAGLFHFTLMVCCPMLFVITLSTTFSPPSPKIANDIACLDFPPEFVFHFEGTQHGCCVLPQHKLHAGI